MIFGSNEENEVAGFLLIFTVALLLFLAPVWGSNPAGHSLTLIRICEIRRNRQHCLFPLTRIFLLLLKFNCFLKNFDI